MTRLALYVDEGRVSCPRRGDVEIDVCLGCEALLDLRTDPEEPMSVMCQAVKVRERRRQLR